MTELYGLLAAPQGELGSALPRGAEPTLLFYKEFGPEPNLHRLRVLDS